MCKPVKEYLSLLREYGREIVTFGGVAAAVFIYLDLRELMHEQVQAYREVAVQLSELNVRINDLEQWHKTEISK